MRTIHSHCYRSLEVPPAVVDAKLIEGDWNRRHPGLALTPAGSSRVALDDVVVNTAGGMPGDEVRAELDHLRLRLAPRARWPERVQAFERKWEKWKHHVDAIDFTDMLEQAADVHPLEPDVVVVDEAQDLSPLAWRRIRTWSEQAGGLLAVGDAYQALYDPWAAADAAMFLDLWRGADRRAVLTQSYRVPAAVHRRAMRWVRQLSAFEPIEYFPRREDPANTASPFVEGAVVRCDARWTDPLPAIQEAEELARRGKSVLFVFTANYLTWPLCNEMRRRLLLFSNPWRGSDHVWNPLSTPGATGFLPLLDPGQRWKRDGFAGWALPLRSRGLFRRGARTEIEALAGSGASEPAIRQPPQLSVEELGRWFEPEGLADVQRVIGTGDPVQIAEWWRDRVKRSCASAAKYAVDILIRRGPDALKEQPRLHPSTAHGAKGGEADHVFLFPDLSQAAQDAWFAGPKHRDPIVRAFYVGMTRARECLHLCEPSGRRFVDL